MVHVPDAVEFDVPPGTDPAAIVDALRMAMDPIVRRPATLDRTLLDTFDGRLHRAGLTLWSRERSPASTIGLTLEANGSPSLDVGATVSHAGRILVNDLPPGAVRTRLEEVVEQRALLPLVRVRSRLAPIDVCDDEGKTVTRVVLDNASVIPPGRQPIPLRRRVRVTPVLGYDRAFDRVAKLLEDDARLAPRTMSLVEEAAAAGGVELGGAATDVDVALDPAMPATGASFLVCRRLAEVVEANLPGVLDDIDTEFLHDLRVAIRRSRAVLKELKGVLPPETEERAKVDLRWIQEITGPTRDLDVQLEEWPMTVATASPAMAHDLPPLRDLLTRHRAEAFTAMRRELQGQRYRQAWAAWRAAIDAMADPMQAGPNALVPIGDLAGARIVAVYERMRKMGRRIDDDSPAEALHDLRKRGKELRYLLEIFGGLWPQKKVKPLVSTLKALQDTLGRFQDAEIQTVYLRTLGPELAAAPGGTDSLIALGGVIDALAGDQVAARQAMEARFAPFAADDTRELVSRTFGSS
jgi:CHAD domain-containing protein